MLFFLLLSLAALLPTFTHATPWRPWHPSPPGPPCLSDAEALDIATRYEDVFNANAITSLSQLTSIVSSNIAHLDENFDESTVGIEAFYESLVAPGNYTTTDAVESVLFLIHSCDQIAVRWQENAITTGYESTVPVGTPVELKGIDILAVDLETRLIYNATSSGDWITLARQLGETCNI